MAGADFFSVAQSIADCICEALTNRVDGDRVLDKNGLEIPWKGQCCVVPGSDAAWDNCCEGGGQGWVVFKGAEPTVNFPNIDPGGLVNCADGHTLAARYEVGVIRCMCEACDCTAKEIEASQHMADLHALYRGLVCCFTGQAGNCGELDWRLTSINTRGPMGLCGGSVISFVVNVPALCCPAPTT